MECLSTAASAAGKCTCLAKLRMYTYSCQAWKNHVYILGAPDVCFPCTGLEGTAGQSLGVLAVPIARG